MRLTTRNVSNKSYGAIKNVCSRTSTREMIVPKRYDGASEVEDVLMLQYLKR